MPFMGGMEATELIRSYEAHKGLGSTPIIALTAHASESKVGLRVDNVPLNVIFFFLVIGDRERCLQAGMDDHITSAFVLDLFSTFGFLLIVFYIYIKNRFVVVIC